MSTPTAWSEFPNGLRLGESEVHLWYASLDPEPVVLHRLETTLTDDERSRGERFVFARDRSRFVAARGILRDTLGKYLGEPPAGLRFHDGPNGKPALGGKNSKAGIRFNLSHSNGMGIYAFSGERELGIDLELIRPDFAAQEIAERFFSPSEIAEWQALPDSSRAEGFFLCWTRKEAYVKARGEGLTIPLQSFDVTLTPGEPAKLNSPDAVRWRLRSFQPAPGYIASMVVEGGSWTPCYWKWAPTKQY